DPNGRGDSEVGDLDADGRLDIASAGPGAAISVYLNKPQGWTHVTYPVGITYPPDLIAVADVTGDGKPDVVSVNASAYPYSLNVYKQQDDGTLAKSQSIQVNSGYCVATGDWDRDGRNDVLVTVSGSSALLFRQQTDGTLAAAVTTPPGSASGSDADCVPLSDLNGDKYPDAVSGFAGNTGFAVAYNSLGAPPPPGIQVPHDAQSFVWNTNVADFAVLGRPATKLTVTTAVALDPASVNGRTVQLFNGK